jgi:uncharacterized 2Fe-2S/4Fe-4S cluster protein (DUF4445 family)
VSFCIRFLPEDRSTTADEPLELFLAAARCAIWVEQPCGSRATCGKCRVKVLAGDAPPTPPDRALLSSRELAEGWRLACQLVVSGDATIEIPPVTRAVAVKSFGDDHLFDGGFTPNVEVGTRGRWLGVAVDLGSTTLASALVDLDDGRVLASSAMLNPQVRFGADVISRIHFAQEHEDGNAVLQLALFTALGDQIAGLCSGAGCAPDREALVACAGNATMTHMAGGADITPLGQAPYLGEWTEERVLRGTDLGLPVRGDVPVILLPMVRSHVGGDTVAGIVACGLDRTDRWCLFVDLGTNSEVVLAGPGRLVATSTAAGPAFEGATIRQGMRAEPGAIDAVRIASDGRVVVSTVANQPARGLCGSGLVDAVAELRRAGVIDASGYMRRPEELASAAVTLRERVTTEASGQRAIRLAADVVLTAQDVRQLQLAKGSIAAGVALLLAHCEITAADLDEVLIAGAFGNFLRKSSALEIGLVPGLDPERVRFVGNAAGVGARMVLVDRGARERAREVGRHCKYVELGGHPGYEEAFCRALALAPDTQLEPAVRSRP